MKRITAITLSFAVLTSMAAAQAASRAELYAETGESPNQFYTLRVYDIGKTIGSENAEDIVRFEQNESDADGNVAFSFEFNVKSGIYPYIIQSETGQWQQTGQIAFTNEEEFEAAMEALAGALRAENSGAAVKAVFDEYSTVFNLEDNFSINSEIVKLDTAKAYTRIASKLTAEAALAEVQNVYRESMLLCALEKGNDSLIKKVDEGYRTALGVTDETIIEKYNSLSDTHKLNVASMEKGEYAEAEEYVKAHTTAVAVASMNACSAWQELDSEITAFNEIAELGFPSVSGSARSSVLQKLVGKKPFASKEDFIQKVNAAVAEINSQGSSSVIKNTGGGGGGGSSSVSYQTTPNPSNGTQQNNNQQSGFSDIDGAEWARDSIEYLVSIGAVSGRSESEFAPNESITREEFVKILVSALNISAEGEASFADMAESAWYKPYVAAAVNSGVVVGIGDNLFGVGTAITRQDAAVMIMRALKYKEVPVTEVSESGFDDDGDIADYAASPVASLAAAKVISGTPEGKFLPYNPITRAETAKLIHYVLVLMQ